MRLTLDNGTLVADRFRIVRFIAEGGMGEVYEAEDEVLGGEVALKFLSQRSMDDEVVRRRFRREIQLARKVTHPNVCRLFDVFRHEQRALSGRYEVTFVTMELLDGETLEEFLEREGRLSEKRAFPLADQMCRALAAAHEVGIVHRDFKTSNVMLVPRSDERLRAVVTDFGLARSMYPHDPTRTPLTAEQLILGTADYMSPEQVTGDPVSPQSDIYALGVVLFEMVSGGKPHDGANPVQVLMQRVTQPPERPSRFFPEISPVWEKTILRCLERDPADRPRSALEIVEALLSRFDPAERRALSQGDPSSTYIPLPNTALPNTALPNTALPSTAELALEAAERPFLRRRTTWLALALAASLLVVAVLAFRDLRPTDDGPLVFAPQRVTTAPGLEIDPALSPDGTRVAYVAEGDDGRFRLQVQSLDATSPPRSLATPLTGTFEPAWSPDGTRLAFHVRGDAGGLWTLEVEASGSSLLASTPSNRPRRVFSRGSRPAWSPDGTRLAFQSRASPLLSDTTVPAPEPSRIEILDLGTGEVQVVTRPGSPAGGHAGPTWTPDGRHLVFNAVSRADGSIWAVPWNEDDASSGEPFPLVDEITAYDPAVSPDGRHLYFTSRSREVKGLWRLRVDPQTLEPQGMPQEIGGVGLSSIRQPSVAAAGGLVFSAYLTRSNLLSVDLDPTTLLPTAAARDLTSGNDRHNRPEFSPAGDALAFDHWKLGVDIDVFLQDLPGGDGGGDGDRGDPAAANRQQLSHGEGTHSHASWLDDGRVAYTADREGARRLVAVDPLNGDEELLFLLAPTQDWAVVSGDGRWLAFHSAGGGTDGGSDGESSEIWVAPLPQGQAFALTQHETPAGFPVWSADGRMIAYQVRKTGTVGTDIWVMPFDDGTGLGGEPRRITDEPGQSWPYSVSPDGRRIAFAALREGRWSLRWVDRLSGDTGILVESRSPAGYLRYPLLSPAGDQLVYERAETLSDLFFVEGLR